MQRSAVTRTKKYEHVIHIARNKILRGRTKKSLVKVLDTHTVTEEGEQNSHHKMPWHGDAQIYHWWTQRRRQRSLGQEGGCWLLNLEEGVEYFLIHLHSKRSEQKEVKQKVQFLVDLVSTYRIRKSN